MIEKALVSLLKADASVYALVGSRIFPVGRPLTEDLMTAKNLRPFLTYFKVSGGQVGSIQGNPGVVKLRRGAVQINAWAKAYTDAKALAAAVMIALNEQRGTYVGVEVAAVLYDFDADLEIPSEFANIALIFGVGSRYKCLWYE